MAPLRATALFPLVLLLVVALPSLRSAAPAVPRRQLATTSTITPLTAADFITPVDNTVATPLTATSAFVTPLAVPSTSNKTRSTSHRRHGNVCSTPRKGSVRCHAIVLLAADYTTVTAPSGQDALNSAFHPNPADLGPINKPAFVSDTGSGRRMLAGNPSYKPQQLQQVYLGGKAPTKCQPVAIIGAYAYPNAQADISYYRSYFGLSAITIAQYDQNGNTLQTTNKQGTGYVSYDSGWAGEQMLDLSMVSAICPCCPIMYFGARSSSFSDLFAAIKSAVRLGAKVVSMSFGGGEGYSDSQDASFFAFSGAAGVVFTASSGDNGFAGGVEYPSSSAYVVAVGGTSLTVDSSGNRASETAWSGAGSGCSQYISKPSWQTDSGCARRMVSDISAVADPNTGVLVYQAGQWGIYGGTSASSPIIAAMHGGGYLGSTTLSRPTQGLYPGGQDYASLYDSRSGTNGPCSGSSTYFCNAVTGYDGPTGNGCPTSSSSGGGGVVPIPISTPTPTPTPTPKPTAPTPAPAPSGGTIANVHFVSGMTDPSGNPLCYVVQNSLVQLAVCNTASSAQLFNLVPTTGGWYFVKPVPTLSQNGCLSQGGGGGAGANLMVQTCNGANTQTFGFFFYSNSNTYFTLRPKYNNNLCLMPAGSSNRAGALIQTQTCSATLAQTLYLY